MFKKRKMVCFSYLLFESLAIGFCKGSHFATKGVTFFFQYVPVLNIASLNDP